MPHVSSKDLKIHGLETTAIADVFSRHHEDAVATVMNRLEMTPESIRRRISEHNNLHKTSAHEAGHATQRLHEGGKVTSVEVCRDGSGRMSFDEYLSIDKEAAIIIAGAIASGDTLASPGARGDRADLICEYRAMLNKLNSQPGRIPRELTDDQIIDLTYRKWNYVDDVLLHQRPFFNALKAKLIASGRVSGAEVHKLWNELKRN